ncbi:MAG: hypothetical protein GY925_18900 [Actinomycetia bacterium]|nr:hypothetical protein [Actinomycetes bacterium]
MDDDEWKQIQKSLRKYAPETKKVMVRQIRTAGNRIKKEAAAGFREYSSRVHKGLGVQVTAKRVAIQLKAKKTAPHAPISEVGGRHPVFGNRKVWVDHPARPRLGPAVDRNRKKIADEISEAIIAAARDLKLVKR